MSNSLVLSWILHLLFNENWTQQNNNLFSGSMTIENLGHLTEASDLENVLVPINYRWAVSLTAWLFVLELFKVVLPWFSRGLDISCSLKMHLEQYCAFLYAGCPTYGWNVSRGYSVKGWCSSGRIHIYWRVNFSIIFWSLWRDKNVWKSYWNYVMQSWPYWNWWQH